MGLLHEHLGPGRWVLYFVLVACLSLGGLALARGTDAAAAPRSTCESRAVDELAAIRRALERLNTTLTRIERNTRGR